MKTCNRPSTSLPLLLGLLVTLQLQEVLLIPRGTGTFGRLFKGFGGISGLPSSGSWASGSGSDCEGLRRGCNRVLEVPLAGHGKAVAHYLYMARTCSYKDHTIHEVLVSAKFSSQGTFAAPESTPQRESEPRWPEAEQTSAPEVVQKQNLHSYSPRRREDGKKTRGIKGSGDQDLGPIFSATTSFGSTTLRRPAP